MHSYRGEWLLLSVSLMAAAGWFVSKNVIASLPPAAFLGIRFSAAALLFLPFALSALRTMDAGQWWRAGAVGLAFFLNIFLWLMGVAHSRYFGSGAFVFSLSMLAAPLLKSLMRRRRTPGVVGLGRLRAAAGRYLLTGGKGGCFDTGSLFFAISALAAALFFVLNNQFAKHIPVLALTTVQMAAAGILCGAYSLAFEHWPPQVAGAVWAWLALCIVVLTNLRFLVQTYAQKLCQIGSAALIMVLEPVWTLLLSVWLLNETVGAAKAAGCTLILAALVIYRLPLLWQQRKTAKAGKAA